MADLTPGATWAIERLRAALPCQEGAIRDIQHHGIETAYLRRSFGHPHQDDLGRSCEDGLILAILQAALAADAQAAVNRDVFTSAGARFAEIWTAIRDLDARTSRSKMIR